MINLKELTTSQLDQCLKEAINYCSAQLQKSFEFLSQNEYESAISIYGVIRSKKNKQFFIGIICYVVEDLSEFITLDSIIKEIKNRKMQTLSRNY